MSMERRAEDTARITQALRTALEPLPYVHALWLEGADSNGAADAYSDLDYYVDFDDKREVEAIAAVEAALESVSPIDYRYIMHHGHPKLRQGIYHLHGQSDYLMIDFCWQLHSREPSSYEYVLGNPIECAQVIFDKSNIIRYRPYNPSEFAPGNRHRLAECAHRYTQHCRILKYLHRNQYLEAYVYYNKYALEPLVDLLRILYTPINADYGLVHISSHLPPEETARLETFAKIASPEDIAACLPEAQRWFQALFERAEAVLAAI